MRDKKTFRLTCVVLFAAFWLSGCVREYYSSNDMPSMAKIDVHTHIVTEEPYFVEQALQDNFSVLTINTEVPYYPAIAEQQRISLLQAQRHPGAVKFAATFTMAGWEEPDWPQKTIAWLDQAVAQGAVAVKVWKNIGMAVRDKTGKFVMIDDPQFDPVFEHLAKRHIPMVGHLGEPKNCWLPIEEMTVENDKNYFKRHPEYHMYLHPDYPSYQDQINARDHMLEKHPHLVFIGAHLGSLEWSVDEMAKRFDRFPNFAVDMTARIGHLQYQSIRDYHRVRNFLIKYQDRILYGTDLHAEAVDSPEKLKSRTHDTWQNEWNYLATDQTLTSKYVVDSFKGLHLPAKVIDKIYRLNAKKWYAKF